MLYTKIRMLEMVDDIPEHSLQKQTTNLVDGPTSKQANQLRNTATATLLRAELTQSLRGKEASDKCNSSAR